jgi:hypothetical protein
MRYVIPAAVAIGVGLLTLITYLLEASGLLSLRLILVDWAVLLAGWALLVGVLNLILVHIRRVQARERGWVYSLITAAAAMFTLMIGSAEGLTGVSPLYTPGTVTQVLFSGIVASSQAALAGLVMFFLVVAAVRLVRNQANPWSFVFLGAVILTLVGWLPFQLLGPVRGLQGWFIRVPAAAGARGILLGVALGTVAVGIRVLTGVERPYKD